MTYSKNGTEETPTSVAEMKTNDAYQGKDFGIKQKFF